MIRIINNASNLNSHNNLKEANNYFRYRDNVMSSTKAGSSIYNASFLSHGGIRSFSARSRLSSGSKR
jgi:hypothetical protein